MSVEVLHRELQRSRCRAPLLRMCDYYEPIDQRRVRIVSVYVCPACDLVLEIGRGQLRGVYPFVASMPRRYRRKPT